MRLQESHCELPQHLRDHLIHEQHAGAGRRDGHHHKLGFQPVHEPKSIMTIRSWSGDGETGVNDMPYQKAHGQTSGVRFLAGPPDL